MDVWKYEVRCFSWAHGGLTWPLTICSLQIKDEPSIRHAEV